MLIQTWSEVFTTSLQDLWTGFIEFVPGLLIAIIIFLLGWMVAAVVGKAFAQILSALQIDKLFKKAGADEVMKRAGLKLNVSGFIGALVKWFIIIVFLMTSLEILNLNQVNDFLRDVVLSYIPNVIIAALILVAATVLASVLKKVVISTTKAAGVESSGALGTATKYAVWVFGIIIALSELNIAPQFMQTLFIAIIGMLALAGGLAFGLGGRDVASRSLERFSRQVTGKE